MFGIRTPVKDAKRAGPSKSPKEEERKKTSEGINLRLSTEPEKGDTSVRRSIGEIEARVSTTRPKAKSPSKPKLSQPDEVHKSPTWTKLTIPLKGTKEGKTTLKNKPVSANLDGSPVIKTPPKKYKSRTAEAKACLLKAKLQIDRSRNLKTDIKTEVLDAIDRLYNLVKEAEEARPPGEIPKMDQTTSNQNCPDQRELDRETITAKMEEQTALLKENNKKMDELKEMMEAQSRKDTYAKVTANYSTTPYVGNRETLHSVVVASTVETETGEEVLDRVRRTVDAKDGWVTVQRIRKAKDRKIVMGFRSKVDQNKVKERLQRENHLLVEEVKNKNPLLVLRDVLLVNTDEDVLRALQNQNRSLFHNLEGEDTKIEIKYRRKARNPLTGHIVISTSPIVWRRALELGALHVDLQRVRIADQSPLVQCTRCLGFGHSKRFCKEPADLCGHCGGPHMRAECTEWLAGDAPTCRNCTKAGRERAEHNAFDRDCPVRLKWDALARAAVAYC